MLIKISHLRKEYENITPLKDVNCEINKGDVIAIIGPSGTGKSTFINCINRLEDATSGSIIFNGEEILDNKYDVTLLRKKIGMVFQSFNLFSHLTIIENIMLGPVKLLNIEKQKAYDEGLELLESVGLKEKAKSYPKELSGGQQQRVAIVRALAMHPEVILFDEPTSALDPTMINEVLSVIKRLANGGMTMLIVTHEMKFARNVATRVFYMDEGLIYEEGTPEQIFDNPTKDKTRQFVKRLKVFNYNFDKYNFALYGLNEEVDKFSYNNLVPKELLYKLMLVIEIICAEGIVPQISEREKVNLTFEYSEETSSISLLIKFGGNKVDAFSSLNDISKQVISKVSKDFISSYEEGINIIKAEIE